MSAAAVRSLDDLRTRVQVGAAPGDLHRLPPRVSRAVDLAREFGAPALPALAAAAAALEDVEEHRRAVRVATAQGRLVAVGLVALPIVTVPLVGRVLDLDLLAFYATPVGRLVGAVGLGLIAVGALLVNRILRLAGSPRRGPVPVAVPGLGAALVGWLVLGPVAAAVAVVAVVGWRRTHRPDAVPLAEADEAADLVATALTGGASPGAALRGAAGRLPAVAPALRRLALGLEYGHETALPAGLERIGDTLTSAMRWGAPAAPSLRRLATDLRAEERARALAAAERLPVLLTFPTALCLLPACIVLVGAPLIASGLAAATAT